MTDPTICIVKSGAISSDDKNALREAGMIVIECDNPSDIRFTKAAVDVEADLILSAAMEAVADTPGAHTVLNLRDRFARILAERIANKDGA